MESFSLTLVAVAIAELGDRTQLLALLLAVKFRKPWAILAGMGIAAIAIHGLSAIIGISLARLVDARILGWGVGMLFVAMGIWALLPENAGHDEHPGETGRGAFLTALVTFFLMEVGDKTQLTSMAMAAHFQSVVPVVLAAALAMVAVNGPVVWLGHRFSDRIPLTAVRLLAATIFLAIGLWTLLHTWRMPV